MPRKQKKEPKSKIPPHGRRMHEVTRDMHGDEDPGLRKYSSDVPLGNTDPTVVRGKMVGGMPNASRMARGGLYERRGRFQ